MFLGRGLHWAGLMLLTSSFTKASACSIESVAPQSLSLAVYDRLRSTKQDGLVFLPRVRTENGKGRVAYRAAADFNALCLGLQEHVYCPLPL